MVEFAPISTSFWMRTRPTFGTFSQPAARGTKPKPSCPIRAPAWMITPSPISACTMVADLRDFSVTGCAGHKAKAVLPDPRTGVDDNAVADQRVHNGGRRPDRAVTSDPHLRADYGGRPHAGGRTDFRT